MTGMAERSAPAVTFSRRMLGLVIDGQAVNDIPAKDRDIAMAFQNDALYPHMTVRNNRVFALNFADQVNGGFDALLHIIPSVLTDRKA